jgi:hypothetical protein
VRFSRFQCGAPSGFAPSASRIDSGFRHYFLAGAAENEQIEVPETLHMVLVQAAALKAGKAVTISPNTKSSAGAQSHLQFL